MPEYGQFCPVAKATDIIGERWTVLILRELLMGTTRYNDLQRGLSRISPTLLSKRLKTLEAKGLIVRKRPPGQKSFQYHLTAWSASDPLGHSATGRFDRVLVTL